ncbi:ornithine cyclodeaminase family protein [Paraburkholderia acidicola]|uniref:Ornithine cyclodeaminase family protein n=1 Tax=Paraburkholderia acidicola TaxID=1912599 RepID=A0ABV1LWI2_9BURK
MLHITDDQVTGLVSAADAQDVLREAFRSFGRGTSAVQERVRTQAGEVKLSTLGAVLSEQGFVGAKVYTTIAGQFRFVILLFSAEDGAPLATLDAAAVTRLRTAATTVLAARLLARRDSKTLALFGAGQQGMEHAIQLCAAFPIERILLVDPYSGAAGVETLARLCGVPVHETDSREAVLSADIVVTATRSADPLFSGDLIRAGAFVAAIGSSLPHTRELDDIALRRASMVVVDWSSQALQEAGDLVLADPCCLPPEKLVDLSQIMLKADGRRQPDDIIIYKSVGIGLQDIALAGLAYSRLVATSHAVPTQGTQQHE